MPTDIRVMQSQRNEVLRRLTEVGLEPREFRWEHVEASVNPGYVVDRLVHVPTGYFFEFDNEGGTDPEGHRAIFSPGSTVHTERVYTQTWQSQSSRVWDWANYLKREIDAPPLWEQLAQGEPMLEIPLEGAQDTQFTPPEQQAIETKLDEVLEYLTRELPAGAIPTVQAQVDRLRAASRTTGRVSWVQMAIGTMVGLVWGGVLEPEQARTVLQMIGQAFQRLIGTG